MPKKVTVTPVERRNWLDRIELGERVDVIARDSGRDTRTINTNIDRARRERNFAAAQIDQLRGSLNAHQQDMLEFLKRIGLSAVVPGLDWVGMGPDFGLEDLLDEPEMSRYSEETFAPAQHSPAKGLKPPFRPESNDGIVVVRDRSGPKQARFAAENSKQWLILLEHIHRREALWTGVANYKAALLDECQARAALIRVIRARVKAATNSDMPWIINEQRIPYVTPVFASYARSVATQRALTAAPLVSNVPEIQLAGNGLLQARGFSTLAECLPEAEKTKEQLIGIVEKVSSTPECSRAADTYRNLQSSVSQLHDTIEDYLLLRYISGSCRVCRLLGAP